MLDGGEQLGGGGVVGQAELVVTGLDDRGQLVAELQRVAGAFVDVGTPDHGGRGGEELLAARSVFSPAPMMVCSLKPRPPVMVNVQVFMAAWSPLAATGARGRTLGCG